ncbi:MAG TPA: phosphoribosylamine--glycine ligase, partial [Candidatus Saccharimonadales bacterium]|nr:phosphoribosylamine--glycine ligase [Candidatus Saccharimonadales bacterium]
MKKIVAVIDGGGRGSALVAKYGQSPRVAKILAIPGNDLMQMNTKIPVQIFQTIKTTDVEKIVALCKKEQVSLVDVAHDNAVAVGLVDALQQEGILTVGPTKAAGRIEWDKAWAREFGERHGLPQPIYHICHSEKEGIAFINQQPDQAWFVKAAGLAEGKGVLPAKNNEEAIEKIKEMIRFGNAGETFLLESWLQGEEFSTFICSDGKRYQFIGIAQDHKRVDDHDEGPNTGGMGAYTPSLLITPDLQKTIQTDIFDKVIDGMQKENIPYTGILYLGGMAVKQGNTLKPYVIEFNARWGDPEVQAIAPGLTNDFFEMSMAIAQGDISNIKITTDGKTRTVVAGTSRGYPEDYSQVKGKQIYGLEQARKIDGIQIYGAGVQMIKGKHIAFGGRLFYIVGEGKTIIEARQKAYEAMAVISIEDNNLHYRTDIG